MREAVSTASAAGACGFAAWRGGAPERIVAATLLGAWLVSPLVVSHDWARTQGGVVVVDAGLAAVTLAVALRSDRWWPLAAAAVTLLILTDHLGFFAATGIAPRAYFVAEEIWSYLLLVLLAGGAAVEAPRRRAQRGQVPGLRASTSPAR